MPNHYTPHNSVESPCFSTKRNPPGGILSRFSRRHQRIIAASAIAASAALTIIAGRTQAAVVNNTSTWIGVGGNALWSNNFNWYLQNYPVNGSAAIIGAPATIAAPTVDDFSVDLAGLTINQNSGVVTNTGVNLVIGNGGYVNDNGQITINSSAGNTNTNLGINGTVTLEGTGDLILNAVPGGNLYSAEISDAGSGNLTQNSGHTISGTGQIQLEYFTNYGTVNADSNGNNLLLQYVNTNGTTYANNGTFEASNGGTLTFGSGPFTNTGAILADAGNVVLNGYTNLTNTGTMQADNGGSLVENSASIVNTGGIIEANGGTVLLNGGKLTGGTLTSIGGSEIDEQGVMTLTNVTISAGSNLEILDGSHIYFSAGGSSSITTTNNGIITINKGGSNTTTSISIAGTVDLAGTGTIVLNSYAGNLESAWISDIGNSNLIQDSNHSISGSGIISVDSFTNNGAVNADTSGQTLLLQTNGAAFTNNGTYTAGNGGTLDVTNLANVSSGTLTGGTYEVDAGSTMVLPGNVTTNAATIILSGAGAAFAAISPITNNTGTFKLENGAAFTTAGNFTNSGTIWLDPSTLNVTGNLVLNSSSVLNIGLSGTQSGQYDTIQVTGSATLGGTLELNLENGFTASVGDHFNFIDAAGGITGNFSNSGPLDINGYVFNLTSSSTGFGLQVTAVPEPASLGVFALGGLALLANRRRLFGGGAI